MTKKKIIYMCDAYAGKHHKILKEAHILRDNDYTPYGNEERWADENKAYPDCSGGCKWFYKLQDPNEKALISCDWGVCANPKSHRCGLLTFEHQGCFEFEYDEENKE